ncbi:hypothetical protein [Flagellimonas meishanensis]|uniref:hypothetical protein n=1 Tax=Flagellimonas meishanensis TaxID=2873264 RepID=UPI001CA727AC|nr:hypothetical protein [[Muricauda] meishanensis]
MKKLVHYPNIWQTYPFSMELFAHIEKEARLRESEKHARKELVKKEKKSKLKLALGW